MIDLKSENSAESNLTDILSKERYEKHKMVGCYAVMVAML
jgi:hypothetical protein